jgi:hypothetical protein
MESISESNTHDGPQKSCEEGCAERGTRKDGWSRLVMILPLRGSGRGIEALPVHFLTRHVFEPRHGVLAYLDRGLESVKYEDVAREK